MVFYLIMITPTVEHRLEENSRILFASKYELAVVKAVGCYAIEPPEPFRVAHIVADVQEDRGLLVGARTVQKEIERLIGLDLALCLTPEARTKREYARLESSLWPHLLSLIDSWSRPPQKQLELFE
jgi:hypothetical protein